jgi:hypothetical protein
LYSAAGYFFLAARHSKSTVFSMSLRTWVGSAVEFFLFEVPKVVMLLTLVVFGTT